MLDTYHPQVQVGALDAATFAFGWITNCMHSDSWLQCFMYFGGSSSKTADASDSGAPATTEDDGKPGMVGWLLGMLGVP